MAVDIEATLPRETVGSMGLQVAPRRSRRLTLREVVLAWIALAVVGTLAYAPHVRHGGFYFDDWANAAGALYPPGGRGFGHALSYYWDLTLYRPVLVLYVPLTYFVFGTHMAFQLAWVAILAMGVAALLYGILRTLGVPWVHAWLIAALTIVYPWFDSTRFWETAGQASVSIIFALSGFWLALVGLQRRSWRLHACAACLYLLSILTYEVTLPLIAAAGILYVFRAGWRVARTRWAVDLVVVVIGGLWVGLHTNHEKTGLSADLRHLKEIVKGGGTILGRTLIPFGEPRTTLALLVLLAVVLAGLAIRFGSRVSRAVVASRGLQMWLSLFGGGLLIAALGWIMYIPANPYYTPTVYGVTNRVNALAGLGLVIAVYGAFGIVGEALGALRPHARLIAPAVTVLLGLLLGGYYVNVLERHSRIWNTAFRAEEAGIGVMRSQYRTLPPGTTVFASGFPAYQTLGVPILSSNWDLNGLIKLQYKTGSLAAYPVIAGESLVCRSNGVGLQGAGAPPTAPYGTARLIDLHTGLHATPRGQHECQKLVGSYTPGPLYLSSTY